MVIEKVADDQVYYDPKVGRQKIHQSVTTLTIKFLDELFNYRVLMGLAKDVMGSILTTLNWGKPEDFMEPGYDFFLLSRPIPNLIEENNDKKKGVCKLKQIQVFMN